MKVQTDAYGHLESACYGRQSSDYSVITPTRRCEYCGTIASVRVLRCASCGAPRTLKRDIGSRKSHDKMD